MNELVDMLLDTGLLQFGRFSNGKDTLPFRFHLEMLPSYPDVLEHITLAMQQKSELTTVDHLVVTSDSVPLGTALSLQTGIPLAYSANAENPYQFIGAYDIGHSALLITNVLNDIQNLSQLAQKAGQVGLEIQSLVAVVGVSYKDHIPLTMPVQVLLELHDVVEYLKQTKKLPNGQAQAISDWTAIPSANLLHLNSIVP